MSERPNVTETALCCMMVSNPSDLVRPPGWQKRVNDHMRAQADRIAALEAEVARLQSEQEQLLSDSAIRSEQREKYEKLCNEMATSPSLTQQEAIDAIKALCRDNERLALGASKTRRFRDISRREAVEHFERAEKLRAALQAHHDWHLAQDRDGGAWGIDPVDAYSESGLCEQTIAALGAA